MPEYRFYLIENDGHVSKPAVATELPDDKAAIGKAKQMIDRHDIEIWEGSRVVAYLVPTGDS